MKSRSRSRRSGVCRSTDLHAAEGDWPVKPKPPLSGREGVGFVSALVPVSPSQGGRPGRGILLYTACGHRRALPRRLGDVVRGPAEYMVLSQWRFADYVVADPNYVGHLSLQMSILSRLLRCCAPGSRSTSGPQGYRHQAWQLGGDSRHRRPRPRRTAACNTPGRWASTSPGGRYRSTRSSHWRSALGATVVVNAVDRSGILP